VDELPLFAQFECEAKGNSSICRQIYYSGFVNFTVTNSPTGIMLGGTVTAARGATITAIAVTAGGNATTLYNPPALGVNSVNLAGTYVAGVCAGKSGNITVNFVITATASNGAQYTASRAGVSIACSTVVPVVPSLPSSSSSSSGGESSSSVNNTPNVSIIGACLMG